MFEIESKPMAGAIDSALEPQYSAAGLRGAILELIYPEAGKLRSRKVVSRSRARATGKYPSWKMGRMIQWESIHERNVFYRLDSESRVRGFQEQPLKLKYEVDGETRTHYPDIRVEWWDGSKELWEVKSRKDSVREEFINRTSLLETALPNYGYRYRMVIGEDFAREPYLSNAIMLLKYGRQPISDLAREQVRQILSVAPCITWESAVNGTLGDDGRTVVCRLVLEGVLTFDNNQPFSAATRFQWARPNGGARS
jgi:hypothetical protein